MLWVFGIEIEHGIRINQVGPFLESFQSTWAWPGDLGEMQVLIQWSWVGPKICISDKLLRAANALNTSFKSQFMINIPRKLIKNADLGTTSWSFSMQPSTWKSGSPCFL